MSEEPGFTRPKLTYEDYCQLPDDGKRHELLEGEHYVTPSPTIRHQRISMNLVRALDSFVRTRGSGEVFTAPLDVILSRHDVAQPDLLFVSAERRELLRDWVRGAPDVVVEILSESTRNRDLGLKRRIYRRRGVKEYWIVDPDTEAVTVWTFPDGGSEASCTFRRGSSITTDLLRGLALPVDKVFE